MRVICAPRARLALAGLVLESVLCGGGAVLADVSLPAVLSSNMVLQRQMDAPIWGWAAAAEHVRVTADWLPEPVATTADENGRWQVRLRTPAAGGPHTISVTGQNTITLANVMIGEVWICSGQSNMEWPVRHALNGAEETAAAEYPDIRLFDVAHAIALSPKRDCQGQWRECDPESAGAFSAVAYFFGRELWHELRVPIGLIGANWGGTVAEAWTSEEALKTMPDFAEALELLALERDEPGLLARRHEASLSQWWTALAQHDPGSGADHGWMSAEYDHSEWKTQPVPSAWERHGLEDFDGIVWFRTEVRVPDEWSGRDLVLELGPVDDMDTTWFNGVRVGGHETLHQWQVPRRYTVPASAVEPGRRNVLAVRVLDTGGAGGLCGEPEQLRLRPAGDGGGAGIPLAGQWRYRAGARHADLPPWPPNQTFHANSPTALFNGMLAPLIPYGMRGVIWYQGESNRLRARQYRSLFPLLIADWRTRWGPGDFPFYYVQIAPFAYAGDTGQAAELREAQMLALATANTGMIVTMDIGDPRDIHPKNKQEVGRRLARMALARTYGREDVVCCGPLYRSMKVEDDRVRLFFDHAAGGLTSGGTELTCFQVAGADRVFHAARAAIEGETVVVSSSAVPVPVAIRYAWGAADEPHLRNIAGLPASSFRTDDWLPSGPTPDQ